jgi:hypothetical protein
MEQQTKNVNRKAIRDFCKLIFEINSCHWHLENKKGDEKEWDKKLEEFERDFVENLKHMIK